MRRLDPDVDFPEQVAAAEAALLARVRGVCAALIEVDGALSFAPGPCGLGAHEGRPYLIELARLGWAMARTFAPGAAASLRISTPGPPLRWLRAQGCSREWSPHQRATWLILSAEHAARASLRRAIRDSAARVAEYRELLPALAVTEDPIEAKAQRQRRRDRSIPLPGRPLKVEREGEGPPAILRAGGELPLKWLEGCLTYQG